jgi:hypothetical protein
LKTKACTNNKNGAGLFYRLPNSSFNLHPYLGPVNLSKNKKKMKSANSNKSGRNARLPNNAVPPGFRYAQPGEQASLAAPQGLTELQKSPVVKSVA